MPIVAIGASAGGLEAASKLLSGLSPASGMAFILVQHLDPSHESLMVDLLGEHTSMQVVEATEGCRLSPDQIYVIPPGRYLLVRAGALHLSAKQSHQGARLPFDCLLGSLAESCGQRTIAVVLSGMGADGSGGLAALKAAGGFVIAQEPEEAEYDGMPRSAMGTGLVDQVLALDAIPQALAARGRQILTAAPPTDETAAAAPVGLKDIIALLREQTPHDFRQYKPGTLERRIERHMALLAVERGNLAAYLDRLRDDPGERDLLTKDLLINVTSFFRDPKVFDALAATVLPDIVRTLPDQQALRVWVAGCSTGEEAYSLAMLCRDAISASGRAIKLQVFASDVDPDAIATAREGLYPLEIAGAIHADRLARYCIKDDAGYRVATSLRGDVVFTVQDLLSDPPFSKIDLISCRNVMIYLNQDAQAKVVSLFHFALREGGVLLLGTSETVGSTEGRFEAIAACDRCYRHIKQSRVGDTGFPLSVGDAVPRFGPNDPAAAATRESTLADLCRSAVLASHAPAAILINRKRQCLYSMGPIAQYLRVAPGYATLDVLGMAAPDLRTKLRLAIDKISKTVRRVDGGRGRVTRDGATLWFRIDVQALAGKQEDLILLCFIEESSETASTPSAPGGGDANRFAELERELEATQAELQAAILHQETSSQEQKAINEEALSVNEEFQSTNEELLTSKEELQSLNEELTALNSQLQETLAVGLAPELLPMITTVTLSRGAMRLARRKVIVKRLASIHDLGAMTLLCTDKTGTLTSAEITLDRGIACSGVTDPRPANLAAVAAVLGGDRGALDTALIAAHPNAADGWTLRGRHAFDFSRRLGSVLADGPEGLVLIAKGAPEAVVALCTTLRQGNATIAMGNAARATALAQVHALAERDGLRTIAVASRSWEVAPCDPDAADEAGLVFEGLCAFADPPKPTAAAAIARLAAAGVQLKILSGDDPVVVKRLAGLVGLRADRVLSGSDIAQLSDDALAVQVHTVDAYGRLAPDQKSRLVRALQARGAVVGYLGDGINDAPALKAAQIGLSVSGATGVAQAAADMILLDQDLAVVADGVEEGRRTFANILKYVRMEASSNFGNMLSMAVASLFLPFLPMLPTQILLNNLLYDVSEIGIPFDSVRPEAVAQPQVWDMPALVRFAAVMGLLSSAFDLLIFAGLIFLVRATPGEFQTAWFLESMATQILVIFVIRTSGRPWADLPRPTLAATSLGAVVVAMLLPFTPVAGLFGFHRLPLATSCAIMAVVIAYLVCAELLKHAAFGGAARTRPNA